MNSSFPSLDQVYRFRSASEKQVWQRLLTGGEGKGTHPGGASAHGDSQALPPGCSAGEVRAAPGSRPPAPTALSRPEGRQEGAPAACGSQTGCGRATWKEGGASMTAQREAAWDAGDAGVIAGSGRSPGGGHGSPLQCSRLGNPMDRSPVGCSPRGNKETRLNAYTTPRKHRRLDNN